jgi:hypothetical protein
MQPLKTLEEKTDFLQHAQQNNYILFFEHDPINECCTVTKNERGQFVPERIFKLADL